MREDQFQRLAVALPVLHLKAAHGLRDGANHGFEPGIDAAHFGLVLVHNLGAGVSETEPDIGPFGGLPCGKAGVVHTGAAQAIAVGPSRGG